AWDKIEDLTGEEDQSVDADSGNPWPVVNNDGEVVGMLWPDCWYPHLSDDPSHPSPLVVSEVMGPVHPYELLSSATTILDAVELFGTKSSRQYFYVTHVNDVVGILRYADLLHPLARLA